MLVCCLAITQGAWAINDVVFTETFNDNDGVGGRDGTFTGTGNTNPVFDKNNIWVGSSGATKAYQACKCVKLGSSSADGWCTTPTINLKSGVTSALLTFSAAGWDDNSSNTLTITVSTGTTYGDTSISLSKDENGEWIDYSVCITDITSAFTITFTGKRIFLDDVVVRNLEEVEAPTLPESCNFWPNTTEAATKNVTIIPASYSSVRYTTDGTTPTSSVGTLITATSNIIISSNTTIKAIGFIGTIASEVTTRTYTLGTTNVNSISEFNALSENTEARLFLSADKNARVLHGQDGKMYLRDNTGTLCMDFGTIATFNPAPQHNQHVAGWIVGKKQTVNGLPKLVATSNTNTNHLALAAPVTEAATAPKAIEKSDINSNVGDWVTVANVRNNGAPITVSGIYTGALVDVSGIITANNSITPVDYADIKPIVYVIDEDEAFVSPGTDITGATIRLKRTLKEGIWNTFCVPMDLAISGDMAGKYRQCNSISGNVMTFGEASSIEAGKPYLVKPDAEIANKVFSNVTLSATPAATVQQGVSGLAFIGTYSPKELKTDKTEQFLTASGKLAYPSSSANATLKGMRAYFLVPEGTEARVSIDGEETTALTLVNSEKRIVNSEVYDLQGRKVANPTKGMYIANGQKVIIK